MRPERGLLDTSVLIAEETGRSHDRELRPKLSAISAVTVGELQAGVLASRDTQTRMRRLATLDAIANVVILPVDEEVALHWAGLRAYLAEARRRVNVNDLWIAATALAHGLPVVTQDSDFDLLEGVAALRIIRV